MYKRTRLDWYDVHPGGLAGLLEETWTYTYKKNRISDDSFENKETNTPIDQSTIQNYQQLSIDNTFIKEIDKFNGHRTTPINDLQIMLNRFPKLVRIVKYDDSFELCFNRDIIKKELEITMNDLTTIKLFNKRIIFTSFERGLKHSGLIVVESTHGTNNIKRWKLNEKKNSDTDTN